MWKIIVNTRLKQVKIILIGDAFPWESFPNSKCMWEDTARADITSHQLNTKIMNVVLYIKMAWQLVQIRYAFRLWERGFRVENNSTHDDNAV